MRSSRLALLACLTIATAGHLDAQSLKAVTGGTVIGAGAAPIADAVIVIDGSRIVSVGTGPAAAASIPAGATIIDARGKFIVPGLADMHNHVRSGSFRVQQNVRTNLSILLAFGVTTVFNPSLSTMEFADVKAATAPEAAPYPRFFGTGPIITAKGDLLGGADGSATPETAADAARVVRALKAAGVDAIKISRDDVSWASTQRIPVMKREVLEALVAEAHREKLKVFAHAPMLEYAKDVLRAGADGLLHGIIDRPVDEELLDLLVRNRAVYVPTLALYEDVADVAAWGRRQSAQDERRIVSPIADSFAAPAFVQQFRSLFTESAFVQSHLPTQRANLKRVFDANVPVVMGTDTGFYGILSGVSSQLELSLMVEAGLTSDEALGAATINAARMLGHEKDAGSIEPGKLADLLVLDADPLADIRNVRRINRVIKGGTVYDPAQLLSGVRVTGPRVPPNE